MKQIIYQHRNLTCLILLIGITCGTVDAQEKQNDYALAREHYDQGRYFAEQEKYIEAVIELEKAIALYPAYTEAYNALGVVHHRQREHQKAIKFYLLAIESNPGDAKVRTNLAMVYNERQEFAKARKQLEKALKSDPDYVLAQKLFDKLKPKADAQAAEEKEAEQQQQQPKAEQTSSQTRVQKMSKSAKKTAQSLFQQGTQLVQQGNVDAGIQAYRKGLKQYPRSAEGHTLLGMAYRQKYHLTDAAAWRQKEISAFRKALKYNSKYVPALLGLGEMYYDQGDMPKALEYFKTVLRDQPDHPAKDQLESIIRSIQ